MGQKDLFDDSTMTFGEHLEVLRVHLWKAIIGLVIGTILAFWISRPVILEIQKPVVAAMDRVFGRKGLELKIADKEAMQQVESKGFLGSLKEWWNKQRPAQPTLDELASASDPAMNLTIDLRDIMRALHDAAPERYPAVDEEQATVPLSIPLEGTAFGKMIGSMRYETLRPRTDGPDEAFMIYLKVSLAVGFVIASPWIIYQLWLFVAAGLYPNERHLVYRYMPLSIVLFLGGVAFCFYLVLPYVLTFLFQFNDWLEIRPEVKIGSWIMFAMVVSLMFGISFQLPLVMVLLEKISLVPARLYREHRRWAILIIAFLSMVLTPSDPVSMLMMMFPLLILYEFGILLCGQGSGKRSPFEAQTA
ncbi:MAG: twin-arginine translocase subunit TatC [Planctomycetaceae bacterium]|nr:MAG: twin-arginine translocase subunit TatC [Planctomycetaceae bacterium]